MTDLRRELRASMKRRGMTPPEAPYAYHGERYRLPEPEPEKPPPRVKTTAEDREVIALMHEAGASWDEIQEMFPGVRRSSLRTIGARKKQRNAHCSRCGSRMWTRRETNPLCLRCISERANGNGHR